MLQLRNAVQKRTENDLNMDQIFSQAVDLYRICKDEATEFAMIESHKHKQKR